MPAPRPRVFPIDAGLAINGNQLSDHNRSAINLMPERFENSKRMANGTLRKFVVAQKYKIKVSWDNLPVQDARTVDGFWGTQSLIDFYNATHDEFTLTITKGDKSTESFTVMFADFSYQLKRRGAYTDFYNVDASFEQV